jgi:hypothetical protein
VKKQSEWMRGLLTAEETTLLHGIQYAENNLRWVSTFFVGDFYLGASDYLNNYKERNLNEEC